MMAASGAIGDKRKQLILSALYRYGMAQVWDGSRKFPSPLLGSRASCAGVSQMEGDGTR